MQTFVLPDLIGKTIMGVVVKENFQIGGTPAIQLHLVFYDQTSVEIYSGTSLALGSALDRGGMQEARRYSSDVMQVIYKVSMGIDGKIVEKDTPLKK